MNEGKVPNWKKSADYAFTTKLDRRGWAWEFMRRSPEYRADFAKVAKAWKAVPREGHLFKGAKAFDVERLERQLAARWGQGGPFADPSSDRVPPFLRLFPIQPDGEQIDSFYYEPDESGLYVQRPDYATLTFDLRKPLPQQLRRAGSMLKKRQINVVITKPPNKGADLWPLYLRVLDADEAGATTAQVIAAIYEYKQLPNSAADGYQADDRVFDHRKRAMSLRADPLTLIR